MVTFWSLFPYLISWSQSKYSTFNSWLILGQILFLLLYFHSISFKLLVFHSPYFLLIQLWGIIFHAWWSTLVLWSLYLLSYIKNLIFSLIWSNVSICCFSSISFQFQSRGGSTYQTSILDSVLSILSLTFSSQNLFIFFVLKKTMLSQEEKLIELIKLNQGLKFDRYCPLVIEIEMR